MVGGPGIPNRELEIKIGKLSLSQNIKWILASLLITVPSALVLQYFSDSPAPQLDAITSVFSIAATLLTAHKKIEAWWYWIIIDSAFYLAFCCSSTLSD